MAACGGRNSKRVDAIFSKQVPGFPLHGGAKLNWLSRVKMDSAAHVSDGGCRDLCFGSRPSGNVILGSIPISSSSRARLTSVDLKSVELRPIFEGITMRHVAVARVCEVVQVRVARG